MPTENLSDLRTSTPAQAPPQLKAALQRLDQALREAHPEDAVRAILRSLDFMLRYFTGVATGLLAHFEPGRPEVQTLSSALDSVERYERLLRFSMAALDSHRGTPAWSSLAAVFYERDEEGELRPRRHARWLKLAGLPLPDQPALSAWATTVRGPALIGSSPERLHDDIRRFLPLLEEWVGSAADFFSSWDHAYRPDADGTSMQLLLEYGDLSFQLVPPLQLQAVSEHAPVREGRPGAASPLPPPARPRQETDTGRTLELHPQQGPSRKLRSTRPPHTEPVQREALGPPGPPSSLLKEFLSLAGLPEPEVPGAPAAARPDSRLFGHFLEFTGIRGRLELISGTQGGPEDAPAPAALFSEFLEFCSLRPAAAPSLLQDFLERVGIPGSPPERITPDPTIVAQFLEFAGIKQDRLGSQPEVSDPRPVLKEFCRFAGIEVQAPHDLLERFLEQAEVPALPEEPLDFPKPVEFPKWEEEEEVPRAAHRFPAPTTEPEELESRSVRSLPEKSEPEGHLLPVPSTEPEEDELAARSSVVPPPTTEVEDLPVRPTVPPPPTTEDEDLPARRAVPPPPTTEEEDWLARPAVLPPPTTEPEWPRPTAARTRFPIPITEPEELETPEGRLTFPRVIDLEGMPILPPPTTEDDELPRAHPTTEMPPPEDHRVDLDPDRLDEELADLPDLTEEEEDEDDARRPRVVLPSQEFLERARRGRFRLGKPWTQEEVEAFEDSLEELYTPPTVEQQPRFLVDDLATLLEGRKSGYVMVEGPEGSGKSFLARTVVEFAPRALPHTVVHFPLRQRLHGDYETLLEILNEHIQVDRSSRNRPLRALAYQVLRDLNIRFPVDCAKRFSSYLSSLSLANDERPLVLLLDGLDELFEGASTGLGLVDYLPTHLPEGIFLVLTYRPTALPTRMAARLMQLKESGASVLEIEPASDDYERLVGEHLDRLEPEKGWNQETRQTLVELARGRLAAVCHLTNAYAAGLFPRLADVPTNEDFYDASTAAIENRFGDRFIPLFLLMATSFEPVSIEELAAFGARRDDLLELLHNLPSLFSFSVRKGRAGLSLAHESFRHYLRANYVSRYSKVCEQLASLALPELKALDPAERPERLRSTLDRLHLWALDSQDEDLMSQVAGSAEVVEIREQVCATLEAQQRFHQKVLIRDGQRELLSALVEEHGRSEFREELAWAHNSRGLTYHRLGQYDRALVDIERAIEHFRILVEEEGQQELLNGLAAAYNRRSEAFRHKNLPGHALEDAHLAVEEYARVVEQQDRGDLRNLLALSIANRAESHRQRRDPERARRDLDEAIGLYSRLVEVENQIHLRAELAQVLHSRACLALAQGDLSQAESDVDRSLEFFQALTEEELYEEYRNDLASAHNDRATIYHRLGQLKQALEEYGQAVDIRQELVAEGRLDVRADLALALTNRGLVLAAEGDPGSALEEHDHALEILTRLTDPEGRDDLVPARAFAHFCRGGTYRALSMVEEARDDYRQAVCQYESCPDELSASAAGELAAACCSLGAVCLELGDLEESTRTCGRGIEVYRSLPPQVQAELQVEQAVAHNNRGEAYRRMGAFSSAREEYGRAIDIYARLVEAGRADLADDLALAHSNRAGVSLGLKDHEQTVRDCGRAIALFGKLVREGGRGELEHHLALAYDRRSEAHAARQKLDAALEDATQALNLYTALVEERDQVTLEDELAAAHRNLGRVLHAQGSFSGALRAFDDSERVFQRLLNREDLPEWSAELARTLLLRSQAHTSLGDTSPAVSDVTHAFTLSPRLVELEEISALQNLLSTLKQRANRLLREDQLEAASHDFTDIINLCRSVMEREPDQELAVDLAQALNHRGWARLKAGQPEAALRDFEAALAAFQDTTRAGHTDLTHSEAWAYTNRANALEALGRLEEAEDDHGQAIELYGGQLAEAASAQVYSRLSASLSMRALLRQKMENLDGALGDASRAVELRGQVVEDDDSWEHLAALAAAHQQKGALAHALGLRAEARAEFDAAIRLYDGVSEDERRPEQLLDLMRCMMARSGLADSGGDPGAVRALEQAVRVAAEMFRKKQSGAETYPKKFLEQTLGLLECEQATDGLLQGLVEMGLAVDEQRADPRSWAGHADLYLRIAFKLPDDPTSHRAYFIALGTLFCGREMEAYGQRSLPRLVRGLFLLGKALRRSPIPPFLDRVGPYFDLLHQELGDYRPDQNLEVEINNMARMWQSLPASIPARTKLSRSRLTSLRRW